MVDEMKKAFLLYDDDGTGKITFKNLERVAQELGEAMSPEELQELITEADADGDGQLSEVSNSPRDSRSAVRALTYAPRCPFVCYAFSVGCVVLRPRGQQHRHFLDHLQCLLLTVLSVAGRVYRSHGRAGSLLSVMDCECKTRSLRAWMVSMIIKLLGASWGQSTCLPN